MFGVDHIWFLTWTTYGTWLPGDPRGFVGPILIDDNTRVTHNEYGTEYDRDISKLLKYSKSQLKSDPVQLFLEHVKIIEKQFHETAKFRAWTIFALAIMGNHIHMLVGVPGNPLSEVLLRDFKSYASRELNKNYSRPANVSWWTESGSRREIKDEAGVIAVAKYICNQERPLLVWIHEMFAQLKQTPGKKIALS